MNNSLTGSLLAQGYRDLLLGKCNQIFMPKRSQVVKNKQLQNRKKSKSKNKKVTSVTYQKRSAWY